jgi:hypothetical protein
MSHATALPTNWVSVKARLGDWVKAWREMEVEIGRLRLENEFRKSSHGD